MNSIEDVYNCLQKNKGNDNIVISISGDKKLIEITLSPIKYILASDDMVELYTKRKAFWMKYWTSTHWHPTSLDSLYVGLMKYLT